jgi:hypothetical protein
VGEGDEGGEGKDGEYKDSEGEGGKGEGVKVEEDAAGESVGVLSEGDGCFS